MGLYAVAAIMNKGSLYGVTVVNTSTLEVFDWETSFCIGTLKLGKKIGNIELRGDGIAFTNGSITRYPLIDIKSGAVKNKDNITVLYGVNKRSGLEYVVANYRGQLVSLSVSRLIEYGNNHTLTNSKVTNKDKGSFISAIHGELKRIENNCRVEFISRDSNSLNVTVPFGVDRVDIPRSIGGRVVDTICTIEIQGDMGKYITYLSIPDTVTTIGYVLNSFGYDNDSYDYNLRSGGISASSLTTLASMINLRTLVILGNCVNLYADLFKNTPSITSIYINSLKRIPSGIFNDLKELKTIKFGSVSKVHVLGQFSGCEKLDIRQLISEGLQIIEGDAYSDCKAPEDIILPKSLLKIGTTAFSGCTNIKSLTITNSSTEIQQLNSAKVGKGMRYMRDEKLLEGNNSAVIYYPYSFPLNKLKETVASGVKLIRMKPTEEELKEKREVLTKISKCNMLGIPVSKYKSARTGGEIEGALRVINDMRWKESLLERLKCDIDKNSRQLETYSITNNCVSIDVALISCNGLKKSVVSSGIGSDFIYAEVKGLVYILLVDRDTIINNMKRSLDYKQNSGYNNTRTLKILWIPKWIEGIQSELESVTEDNENIILRFKDGTHTDIDKRHLYTINNVMIREHNI